MVDHMKLAGASAIAMALWSQGALAQDAVNPGVPAAQVADAAGASASNTGVGEIIVTAQRRSERLQDVPIAITAVTAEALSRSRITDASRLQFLSPGLSWGQQGADSFPAIRGVRTQLVSAQTDPVIGFYIDGVYQSRTQQQSFPLFDLSRVEVQRGPQGTLYGRNTFGGNISVVTNQPTMQLEGGINMQLGNYDLRQLDGYFNVPLGDKVQFRIAGTHIEHDGYVKSTTTPNLRVFDENQSAVRASLRLAPTEKLEILLHGAYWVRDDNGGGAYGYRVAGTLINPATGTRSITGVPYRVNPSVRNGTNFVNGVDIGVSVNSDPYTNQWDYTPFEKLTERYVSGQINYDLGPVVARSITGYNKFHANRSADLDQSSVVFTAPAAPAVNPNAFIASGYQAANTTADSFSQELQLASNGKQRLEWIVGGYFFQDQITELYSQVYTAPNAAAITGNRGLSTRSRVHLNTKAYAAYGQATYAIVPDKLRITGGIRYSDETKNYGITNFTSPAGTDTFPTQNLAQTSSGSPKFHKTTWRAGAEFTPTRNNMFYGSVSTGFESGGINNNSTNPLVPESYAPQTVTAYEVGTKNRFLNNHVALDVSLFYNKYKNLQITILDPLTNISYYSSAGAARAKGAEVDLKINPYAGLHVDLTATYLDAEFTRYTRPNPFGNTTTVTLAGNDVPMSPKLKTTASVYYDFDIGDAGTIAPHVDWLHSTHYYATDYNTVLDRQGSYDVLDASIRWTSASKQFYAEGFVNNLTDKAVLYSATVGGNARIQVSYGPPRLYGARFGAKF